MTDLRVRWLGRVDYDEADALQRAVHASGDEVLLLLEHPHTYTLGRRGDAGNVLVDPTAVGAVLRHADRGGDVTYHGPGQLVAYPIVSLPAHRGGLPDAVAYVRRLEQVVVRALADLGVTATTDPEYPGVWTASGKVAQVGVRVEGGRTRHGIAINVHTDAAMFGHIVPCGIADRPVASLTEHLGRPVEMGAVADAFVAAFAADFGHDTVERQDVAWREAPEDLSAFSRRAAEGQTGAAGTPVRLLGRLEAAGVEAPAPDPRFRRPDWMRVRADFGPEYRELKRLVRDLDLHTVCEEAGCPNISECWSAGTATLMLLGERCTRACGFCLIDTRRPEPADPAEPERVAAAVARMGLAHAVLTMVARDDLADGGAAHVAATIAAIRAVSPGTRVEVLISDLRGDADALEVVIAARPDVLNHNLETVARLQRAVRPSAGYARSLALLARSAASGLVTKSGIMVGLGETTEEVHGALADLRAVGVGIVTIGQYLRPSSAHLPVVRWWTPDEFAALADHGRGLGIAHVESGPLVRSSYHAREGASAALGVGT
ncbi:MAG: lipoyl synthase [Actinomycetes bacterium]